MMKMIASLLLGAATLSGAFNADAQSVPGKTSHASHADAISKNSEIPESAQEAVAVVDRFGTALAAGDLDTVERLLDPGVLILESGGAERSRAEYMGHHAISDAKFLKGSHRQLNRRVAGVSGDLAWVGSEGELHASKDGKPLTLLSTESMVLRKTGAEWRIVHIHWSSRSKKAK